MFYILNLIIFRGTKIPLSESAFLEKAYDTISRRPFINILIESIVPKGFATLIETCLDEMISTVWIGKYISFSLKLA